MWPNRSFLRMWPHLLKKSLTENFIFCAVFIVDLEKVVVCWVGETKKLFSDPYRKLILFFLTGTLICIVKE